MSRPSAPTGLKASAGYGMASVEWQPPESNPVVLSYTVVASDLTTIVVSTPTGGVTPPLQAIFGGMTNGAPLTFTVTATNADGDGLASEPSDVVTPRVLPGNFPNVLTALMGQMWLDYATYGIPNPPSMFIGKQYLAPHGDAPRIVFVPVNGSWKAPYRNDGNGVTTPKQLWGRAPMFDAHIWGVQLPTRDSQQDAISHYGTAEVLMNNLAASLRRVPGAAVNYPDNETWPDADGANLARGATAVLRFSLLIPAVDYLQNPTTLEALPQTVTVTGLG